MFRYSFQLPFRLRINEKQKFPLPNVEASVVIWFTSPPPKEGEPLMNTILVMDSNVSMEIDPNWSLQAYLYVNNIIRAYQVVTKDIFNVGIINQLTWNQFMATTLIVETDESGKAIGNSKTLFFSLGIGAGPISDAEYKEVKAIAESPSLMAKRSLDEFLIRAKIFDEQHNFRMAVLESLIALEFALYSLVRSSAKKKGMTVEATEGLISTLGIAKILNSLPKFSEGQLPSAETINACKEANLLRNKILHQACLDVKGEEARLALTGVESFITHYKAQIERAL